MRKAVLFALAMATAACAAKPAPTYIDPLNLVSSLDRRGLNEIIVEEDFDRVWTALVEYASRNFFPITNVEKASGLMTLEFTSERPSEFVDCGVLDLPGAYSGPYLKNAAVVGKAGLHGIMNIFVKPLVGSSTRITIHTRYLLSTGGDGLAGQTWSFGTTDTQTRRAGDQNVTCMSTVKAERDILEAILTMTGGR